jgi:RNA polymerase sigma-70 factor (ECF subfamily)
MADRAAASGPGRDPASFGAFYAANAKPMLVFFTRRVLDPETALELTAETFAQALTGWTRLRTRAHDGEQAWIYTIARRQLNRYLRRGYADRRMRDRLGIELPDTGDEEIARIHELAATRELRAVLAESVDRLPADQRRALRLRIIEERSYPEVATALMISEEAARARVSRALRSLRHALAWLATSEEVG